MDQKSAESLDLKNNVKVSLEEIDNGNVEEPYGNSYNEYQNSYMFSNNNPERKS